MVDPAKNIASAATAATAAVIANRERQRASKRGRTSPARALSCGDQDGDDSLVITLVRFKLVHRGGPAMPCPASRTLLNLVANEARTLGQYTLPVKYLH